MENSSNDTCAKLDHGKGLLSESTPTKHKEEGAAKVGSWEGIIVRKFILTAVKHGIMQNWKAVVE